MGRSDPVAQSLSRLVLPNPAGAETSVSFWGRLSFSRSVKRRLWTRLSRGGG
jgi:hypothetical protein